MWTNKWWHMLTLSSFQQKRTQQLSKAKLCGDPLRSFGFPKQGQWVTESKPVLYMEVQTGFRERELDVLFDYHSFSKCPPPPEWIDNRKNFSAFQWKSLAGPSFCSHQVPGKRGRGVLFCSPFSIALPRQHSHLLHRKYILDLEDKKTYRSCPAPTGIKELPGGAEQNWLRNAKAVKAETANKSPAAGPLRWKACWAPGAGLGLALNERRGSPHTEVWNLLP